MGKTFHLLVCAVLACHLATAGERELRLPGEDAPIQIPTPGFGGSALDMTRQEGLWVEWRGNVMGVPVEAVAKIGERLMDQREFAAICDDVLRPEEREHNNNGVVTRLSKPVVVSRDESSLVVSQTVWEPGPRHWGGGNRRRPLEKAICFGHVRLHGRYVLLTLLSDVNARDTLAGGMTAWVDALLRLNPERRDAAPVVQMEMPGRGHIAIPFPEGFEHFSDDSAARGLPVFTFTDNERGGKGAARRSAEVKRVTDRPMSDEDFRLATPEFDKAFLALPSGMVAEHGRDSIKYWHVNPDRGISVYSVVCRLNGYLFRFDMSVPQGNRHLRERAEQALDRWVEATGDLNRQNGRHGGREWRGRR